MIGRCIYKPTCSDYTIQAIRKYGLLKGGRISVIRMSRCNGLKFDGGFDPLP